MFLLQVACDLTTQKLIQLVDMLVSLLLDISEQILLFEIVGNEQKYNEKKIIFFPLIRFKSSLIFKGKN